MTGHRTVRAVVVVVVVVVVGGGWLLWGHDLKDRPKVKIKVKVNQLWFTFLPSSLTLKGFYLCLKILSMPQVFEQSQFLFCRIIQNFVFAERRRTTLLRQRRRPREPAPPPVLRHATSSRTDVQFFIEIRAKETDRDQRLQQVCRKQIMENSLLHAWQKVKLKNGEFVGSIMRIVGRCKIML